MQILIINWPHVFDLFKIICDKVALIGVSRIFSQGKSDIATNLFARYNHICALLVRLLPINLNKFYCTLMWYMPFYELNFVYLLKQIFYFYNLY